MSNMEIRYVWELPVRASHWLNVLSVVVLSLTGFYIGYPFFSVGQLPAAYTMGWARFIHYSFGWLLTVSMCVRLYWFLVGNHDASWRMFRVWFTPKGRSNAWRFFKYYIFAEKKLPYEVGHNPLAVFAYGGVYTLLLFQIISGFALYSQYHPTGVVFCFFSPIFNAVGSQPLRLAHHLAMWLLWGFVINHVYSAWMMDCKEMNGTISSMFSGYKYIVPEDLDE